MGRSDKNLYTKKQRETIKQLEADLAEQLGAKSRRYAHSISVARECERLALIYGVDPYPCRVAGILHDWDKVLSPAEQIRRANNMGVDLGVPNSAVPQVLHGIIAAKELKELYPKLPKEVFPAIARHTTGAADMSDVDMIVFVADGIEPLRPKTPGVEKTRMHVGKVSLNELYYEAFVGGIIYVIEGGRYLYPGALETYNELARIRRKKG